MYELGPCGNPPKPGPKCVGILSGMAVRCRRPRPLSASSVRAAQQRGGGRLPLHSPNLVHGVVERPDRLVNATNKCNCRYSYELPSPRDMSQRIGILTQYIIPSYCHVHTTSAYSSKIKACSKSNVVARRAIAERDRRSAFHGGLCAVIALRRVAGASRGGRAAASRCAFARLRAPLRSARSGHRVQAGEAGTAELHARACSLAQRAPGARRAALRRAAPVLLLLGGPLRKGCTTGSITVSAVARRMVGRRRRIVARALAA